MCPYDIKGFVMLICPIAGDANGEREEGERGEERGTEEREILRNWSPQLWKLASPQSPWWVRSLEARDEVTSKNTAGKLPSPQRSQSFSS